MIYFAGPIEITTTPPEWANILGYLAILLVTYLITHRPLQRVRLAFNEPEKYKVELIFVKFIVPVVSLILGFVFYDQNDNQLVYLIIVPIVSLIILESLIGIELLMKNRLE